MKAIILAGGLGTRIAEETHSKPKPMVEIGGKPILWHIMKIYSHYGINDFVICCGYKGYVIKEYFVNYLYQHSDLTVDLTTNTTTILHQNTEPWRITMVDTGYDTQTGGRLLRLKNHLAGEKTFAFTYGDGLTDANLADEIAFHEQHGKIATVLAVMPPGRYGAFEINGTNITSFKEKPRGDGGWINGGFFILNHEIFQYLTDDTTIFEREPLENLAKNNQLAAFFHNGFWYAMDMLRDKNILEEMWQTNNSKWKKW